jgi:hypothetical protein
MKTKTTILDEAVSIKTVSCDINNEGVVPRETVRAMNAK